MTQPLVSIVVTCHNYAQYVALAVESALAQTYPRIEVVVVDDGSTDDSAAVLARFAERIVLVRQENRGHVGAVNRGFAASRGDIVLFLDADDLLRPDAVERVARVWHDECAKVQFELEIIDGDGAQLGRRYCNFVAPYDETQIAAELAVFGTYNWPVLSGNAYSRWYLQRLMPLPVPRAPDGYLNTLAPLYGSIRVLHEPLGSYRLHDAGQSLQGAASPDATERFVKRIALRRSELRHLAAAARTLNVALPSEDPLDRELPFINYRMMLRRLRIDYEGASADGLLRLWLAAVRTLVLRPVPAALALSHFAWFTALLVSPRPLARLAIALRFNRAELRKRLRRRVPPAHAAQPTPLISIIIPNYNYEAYLRAAIDSALALEWPRLEVIVIDDGSTDGSRAILESYGTRIQTIYQENSGQLVACNKGFAASRGDVVIFLDSDDVLDPTLARELAAVWSPGVSKVQVQMRGIDAQGRPNGSVFPQYARVPTPAQIRAWAIHSSAYPTPPGSGNAYARGFLERIFPLHDVCGTANDSYCVAAAPLLGDVVTIAKPLVSYRVHGRNQGAMLDLDARQFARQLTRAQLRREYARSIGRSVGVELPERGVDRSLTYLCYRLSSLTVAPQSHPIAGDRAGRCVLDITRAFFAPQGVGLKARLSILAWAWGVWLLPAAWSRKLILWRFAPGARPHALRTLLTRLRVVRA